MSAEEREIVLKSLCRSEASFRYEQIEPAENHTFEWLFEDSNMEFMQWLKSGRGLYWMRGKPASGKSTLMKMAYNDQRTKACLDMGHGKKARAAFFFHDRGSEVQKSFEGLLERILYQILQGIPELVSEVTPFYTERLRGDQAFQWGETRLQQALDRVLHQNKLDVDICLFIDALDEYSWKHESIGSSTQKSNLQHV